MSLLGGIRCKKKNGTDHRVHQEVGYFFLFLWIFLFGSLHATPVSANNYHVVWLS